VQQWKSLSDNGSLLQRELDLSDLFNPDTFLGALRQLTAREFRVSMDELKLSNAWSRGGIAGAKIPIRCRCYESFELRGADVAKCRRP
jgi:dynein heavy chain 2